MACRKNSGPCNLNSDASNLNLVARNFGGKPSAENQYVGNVEKITFPLLQAISAV